MNRRTLLKLVLSVGGAVLAGLATAKMGFQQAWADTKRRIVAKGTPMSRLMHAHPGRLDTSALETTPIEKFDVMGETTLEVDLENWRLIVDGDVHNPAQFSYEEVVRRPLIERNALLVCPGFFAYNGRWTGISVGKLLRQQGIKTRATDVVFHGSRGFRKKKKRFSLGEVLEDKIFIAYKVNGQILPRRHGFPMRLVALDHRGTSWIKYINRVTVVTR